MHPSLPQALKPINLPPLRECPLVSALVANYNYARFLPEAMESALKQTYPNLEIVVCDDGSTDNSCQVVERFASQDARIKLIRQANGGVSSALNAAYAGAQGDLIAVLDADDAWFPQRLDFIVRKFVNKPEVGLVTHLMRGVDAFSRTIHKRIPEKTLSAGWLGQELLCGKPIVSVAASALTFRRQVAELIFPLPEAFRKGADALLRNRAMLLAPVGTVEEVLALYRLHGNNLTGLPTSLSVAEIDAQMTALERIQQDVVDSARRFHGVDPQVLKDVERPEKRSLVLSRALLNGQRLSQKEIAKSKRGGARWWWAALFISPPWLSKRIYVSWRKGGMVSRLARLVAQ